MKHNTSSRRYLSRHIVIYDVRHDMSIPEMLRTHFALTPEKITYRSLECERNCFLYLGKKDRIHDNLRDFVSEYRDYFPAETYTFFLYRVSTFCRLAGVSTMKPGTVEVHPDIDFGNRHILSASRHYRLLGYVC